MNSNLPQNYFSKILRAIVEFELIKAHDSILIGLSGGKDSLFLVYALTMMKKYLKIPFTMQALTIDPMFSEDFNTEKLTAFCQKLAIPHQTLKVDIKRSIQAKSQKSPCFTCSFLRHGAINHYANKMHCNKVAYAHHHDDAVETFLMSLFYSGQIHTFTPTTYLDRTKITIIRPLVYMREQEIIQAQSLYSLEPLPSPCPYNGNTIRQKTKELIRELSKDNPCLYDHLSSAMRKSAIHDLWEKPKSRKEMKMMYQKIMFNH